jgi:N-acetylglutamate synthase-like GNAT family acetyltransferase
VLTGRLLTILPFLDGALCRTMQWFLERGFQEVAVDALPKERQALYNWQRRSKIYMKKLKTSRDLDAEELFMNV